MEEYSDGEVRTRIRLRLLAVERSLVAQLGEERTEKLRIDIRKRLLKKKQSGPKESGIMRPTISIKDLCNEGDINSL